MASVSRVKHLVVSLIWLSFFCYCLGLQGLVWVFGCFVLGFFFFKGVLSLWSSFLLSILDILSETLKHGSPPPLWLHLGMKKNLLLGKSYFLEGFTPEERPSPPGLTAVAAQIQRSEREVPHYNQSQVRSNQKQAGH